MLETHLVTENPLNKINDAIRSRLARFLPWNLASVTENSWFSVFVLPTLNWPWSANFQISLRFYMKPLLSCDSVGFLTLQRDIGKGVKIGNRSAGLLRWSAVPLRINLGWLGRILLSSGVNWMVHRIATRPLVSPANDYCLTFSRRWPL